MTLQGKPSTSLFFLFSFFFYFRNTNTSSGNTLDIIYQSIESTQNNYNNNKKNLRPKSWISVDFDGFTYPTMKKGRRMSMGKGVHGFMPNPQLTHLHRVDSKMTRRQLQTTLGQVRAISGG